MNKPKTKDEILEKLRIKKGYQKKGVQFLADKWSVSKKLIQECKKLVLSEEWVQERINNENENELNGSTEYLEHLKKNGLTQDDVKSVKFWQNFNGEQRFSIVTHNAWHEMPKVKQELLEYIKKYSPKVTKIKHKKGKDPNIVEISLPDIHYGKVTGEGPKAIERHYLTSISELYNKVSNLNIDRIILPIGNDGMNSEGLSRATTKGTPQYDYMDWRQSFRGYWGLVAKSIDYLSQFAPVDIIIVQGNHDFERMFYAGEVLSALYTNNKNVTVDNDYKARKYYQYGVNMVMWCHGDKIKADKMALLMATEQPLMWSTSKFREAHCGHVHKEQVNEYMGTKVRFIPSICGNDEWHKNRGYIGTIRAGQVHIWNKERGYEGYLQTNVLNYGVEEKN